MISLSLSSGSENVGNSWLENDMLRGRSGVPRKESPLASSDAGKGGDQQSLSAKEPHESRRQSSRMPYHREEEGDRRSGFLAHYFDSASA